MQSDLFSKGRTQKQIIIEVLKHEYPNYVPSYELEKVRTPWGWIGTSGDRRCRELEAEGKLETEKRGQYVYYRIKRKQVPRII